MDAKKTVYRFVKNRNDAEWTRVHLVGDWWVDKRGKRLVARGFEDSPSGYIFITQPRSLSTLTKDRLARLLHGTLAGRCAELTLDGEDEARRLASQVDICWSDGAGRLSYEEAEHALNPFVNVDFDTARAALRDYAALIIGQSRAQRTWAITVEEDRAGVVMAEKAGINRRYERYCAARDARGSVVGVLYDVGGTHENVLHQLGYSGSLQGIFESAYMRGVRRLIP